MPATYQANEAVADALTYLRRPREAERFYKVMLDQNPSAPFKACIGLFTTYTTLREWKKAEDVWERIDDLIKNNRVNWMERHEALTARGWFLISQDRLKDAQDYFEARLQEAGLDPGFRAGLAHVYEDRGWPRKALEQFRIAEGNTTRTTLSRGWGWPTP